MSVQSNEQRYFDALRRIAGDYDSSTSIAKAAGRRYGLEPSEAMGMAYDNIQAEARAAIRGKRRPVG